VNSIQIRLSLGLFVSLALSFSYLWLTTRDSIRFLSEDYVLQHLAHDAESILNAIQVDASNHITLHIQQIEPVYLRPFSGQYYQIKTSNALIRSRSLWDQDLLIPDVTAGEQKKLYLKGPKQQPLIVLVYGFYKQGVNFTLAVAEDTSPSLASQQSFQYRYSYRMGILLVILICCQIIILRISFKPFKSIQKQIKKLRQSKIEQLDTQVPEEAKDLVCEINHLLTVLESRLQRSRNALGDLAHALKIPLTVIQQMAQSEELKQQPKICQDLQKQTTVMQNIMGRVLKQARLAGDNVAIVQFNARAEVPELIKLLQNMYREKELSIQYTITGKDTIAIDREDMMELLGNLLDNACKWAKSRINLSIENTHNLHIVIEDDGPGISEKNRDELMKRGTRLDEMKEGYGLGLSIVKYMVQQHGGQLRLNRSSQLGGLSVEITL
jgi:signal transduction histidine kinase